MAIDKRIFLNLVRYDNLSFVSLARVLNKMIIFDTFFSLFCFQTLGLRAFVRV